MATPRSLNKNNSGERLLNGIVSHAVMLNPWAGHHHLAVKRIMQEARELANDPSTEYSAAPLEVRVLFRRFPYPYSRCCMSHAILTLHFAPTRVLRTTFSCVFSHHVRGDAFNCSCSIYVGLRSGIAPYAGLRAQISREDCIISGFGYLRNIHSVHRVSCSSPPTADLN